MKILIFYTPRSKSTMVHDMCCKKYGVLGLGDMVTKSRIKNKNFNEYEQLISVINASGNICVKLNGNDFFDNATNAISDLYKHVNFQSFDKIIFLTRKNLVDAVLSYAYMDPANDITWHRRKNQIIAANPYYIPAHKIHHLLNGYSAYWTIKKFILSQVANTAIYDYEYDTVTDLIKILDLDEDIDLIPIDINYRNLVSNYDDVMSIIRDFEQLRG